MKKGIHSNTIGMGMNGDILAASRGQQSCGDIKPTFFWYFDWTVCMYIYTFLYIYIYTITHIYIITLWWTNIAMENGYL